MADLLTCVCGCGLSVSRGHRWARGHNNRNPLPQYVVAEYGCWVWQWCTDKDGYGLLWANGRRYRAHRWYWEQANGPIPDGLVIDHLCRNPSCVNPAHMEVVTHEENTRRGDNPFVQNARKTHCMNGHPFDEQNTYIHGGTRHCKTCGVVHTRERRERIRQCLY